MFTGIIEELGTIQEVAEQDGQVRLTIRAAKVMDDLAIGDSVAINGCCLTVVALGPSSFAVELSPETLSKTAPSFTAGAHVNIERAIKAGGRFGGHLVSGHVEGVGKVLSVTRESGAHSVTIEAPPGLAKYLTPKGSITVDGVSLTIVDVGGPAGTRHDLAAHEFTLALIPHTLQVTTLQSFAPGREVNLEPDLIAKYIERLTAIGEVSVVA